LLEQANIGNGLNKVPAAACGDYGEVIVRAERDKKSPWSVSSRGGKLAYKRGLQQKYQTHTLTEIQTNTNNLINILFS
jgi:hypothetical protein